MFYVLPTCSPWITPHTLERKELFWLTISEGSESVMVGNRSLSVACPYDSDQKQRKIEWVHTGSPHQYPHLSVLGCSWLGLLTAYLASLRILHPFLEGGGKLMRVRECSIRCCSQGHTSGYFPVSNSHWEEDALTLRDSRDAAIGIHAGVGFLDDAAGYL